MDFQIHLEYPKYLRKNSETVKGTGNVNIPEGTKVSWELNTKSTERVAFVSKDSVIQFERKDANFGLTKPVFSNFDYKIKTSNSRVEDHEVLEYSISAYVSHIGFDEKSDCQVSSRNGGRIQNRWRKESNC